MVSFELVDKINAFVKLSCEDGWSSHLLFRAILLFLYPSATPAAMMCYNVRNLPLSADSPQALVIRTDRISVEMMTTRRGSNQNRSPDKVLGTAFD